MVLLKLNVDGWCMMHSWLLAMATFSTVWQDICMVKRCILCILYSIIILLEVYTVILLLHRIHIQVSIGANSGLVFYWTNTNYTYYANCTFLFHNLFFFGLMTDNLLQEVQHLKWQLQIKEQELQQRDEKIYENHLQIRTRGDKLKASMFRYSKMLAHCGTLLW